MSRNITILDTTDIIFGDKTGRLVVKEMAKLKKTVKGQERPLIPESYTRKTSFDKLEARQRANVIDEWKALDAETKTSILLVVNNESTPSASASASGPEVLQPGNINTDTNKNDRAKEDCYFT